MEALCDLVDHFGRLVVEGAWAQGSVGSLDGVVGSQDHVRGFALYWLVCGRPNDDRVGG